MASAPSRAASRSTRATIASGWCSAFGRPQDVYIEPVAVERTIIALLSGLRERDPKGQPRAREHDVTRLNELRDPVVDTVCVSKASGSHPCPRTYGAEGRR